MKHALLESRLGQCSQLSLRRRIGVVPPAVRRHAGKAAVSTTTAISTTNKINSMPPHSLLPPPMFWRSLFVGAVASNRLLFTPALAILTFFSKPRRGVLNINKNPILRSLFKKTVYDQFCAGENPAEVKATIRRIKDMGFKGVILEYAAEVVVDASGEDAIVTEGQKAKESEAKAMMERRHSDRGIDAWRKGVFQSLEMIDGGDYLALKLSGAGPAVAKDLEARKELPPQMSQALDDICKEAIRRGASILIDAEQQSVQPGIDRVTMDLMRKYNHDHAVIFNTYQVYLKGTQESLLGHLREAQGQDFTLGVKLVRGAYIDSEPRHLINDTKADTDVMYDFTVKNLLQQQYPSLSRQGIHFPRMSLFLATHNSASVLRAYELQQSLARSGHSLVTLQFGQLLGMADGVSCTLLQLKSKAQQDSVPVYPFTYKCLSWGTVYECISYLHRRAVENKDAVARTDQEYGALKREAFRRIKTGLRLE